MGRAAEQSGAKFSAHLLGDAFPRPGLWPSLTCLGPLGKENPAEQDEFSGAQAGPVFHPRIARRPRRHSAR